MSEWKANSEDSQWLNEITQKLIDVSTVRPGQQIQTGKNITGRSLLTPGYNTYPAFWTRDPAWIAESGFISVEEIWGWITLMAETIQGCEPKNLASGGVILPYSLADHINMDGKPVYYPGTYASDETQGPPWGKYPPHDDQYCLTFSAYVYARLTNDWQSFSRDVQTPKGNLPLWQVCELTHNAFPVDLQTELCIADEDINEHIVDWGYNDTVTKTGKLLFPSLSRLESALKMEELFRKSGNTEKAKKYQEQSSKIRKSIVKTFYKEYRQGEGWLMSSTGLGYKPDVWGSAFAVYCGFVDNPIKKALSHSLLRGFREKTTVLEGQVRHIPTSDGFWEKSMAAEGTYQNGAYWGYPSGWYIYALTLVDESAAKQMFLDFIHYMRSSWNKDFKSCIWECINPEIGHYKGPGYMTTVALPYTTLKKKKLLKGF